jgi:hypothetical protein
MNRLALIILFSLPLISFGQYRIQTVFISYDDGICYSSADTNFIKVSYSNDGCNIYIDYDTINEPINRKWKIEFVNNSIYALTFRKVENSNNWIFGFEPYLTPSVQPYQEFTVDGIVCFSDDNHFEKFAKTISYRLGYRDENNRGGNSIIVIHIKGYMDY